MKAHPLILQILRAVVDSTNRSHMWIGPTKEQSKIRLSTMTDISYGKGIRRQKVHCFKA
jgi:hypothetical protein